MTWIVLYIFSASSDNTGTIVASVIVVIVLLVLLAALLVFYLRTKQKANALIQESNVSHINCIGFGNDIYESVNAVSYLTMFLFCVEGIQTFVLITFVFQTCTSFLLWSTKRCILCVFYTKCTYCMALEVILKSHRYCYGVFASFLKLESSSHHLLYLHV